MLNVESSSAYPVNDGNGIKANTVNIYKINYSTTTGKTYPIEIGIAKRLKETVPVNKIKTTEACIKGCKLFGRNGGCPPFSPEFSSLHGNNILILYAKMKTIDFPEKVIHGPYYSRWVFVETFMTPLTNRLGKFIAAQLDGYFLSSGHCSTCRPKKCSVKLGNNCCDPKHRTYSLESTGVIVTELVEKVFGIELEWWDPKNNKIIPNHMMKIVGVLVKNEFSLEAINTIVREAIRADKRIVQDSIFE
ncbi:MAG: DUF2284 domain-containing protein [Pseudomonadota bacterium]